MVLEGRSDAAVDGQDALTRLGIITVVIDDAMLSSAVAAWRRFGKGRHPASLNYGDCFSYALAAARGLPLLCVGNDFARTDLDVWSPP